MRILIIGDSFMKPDPEYPGKHFSEMLGDREIVVLSQDGSSMGMILDQIILGLDRAPDAMIIGFTAPDRMEYPGQRDQKGRWIPSGAVSAMTSAHKELDLLWQTHNSSYMNDIKAHAMASGIMTMLRHLRMPFAWTPNLLFSHDLWDHHAALHTMLAPFTDLRTPTNFCSYGKCVASPGFHVDDPAWQQRFAQECLHILASQG